MTHSLKLAHPLAKTRAGTTMYSIPQTLTESSDPSAIPECPECHRKGCTATTSQTMSFMNERDLRCAVHEISLSPICSARRRNFLEFRGKFRLRAPKVLTRRRGDGCAHLPQMQKAKTAQVAHRVLECHSNPAGEARNYSCRLSSTLK